MAGLRARVAELERAAQRSERIEAAAVAIIPELPEPTPNALALVAALAEPKPGEPGKGGGA